MQLKSLYESLKAEIDDLDARIIIEECAGLTWTDIIANPDKVIAPDQITTITTIVERRKNGEPLSRILGKRQFWGLDFALSPETLDPRPDTEILVEHALAFAKTLEAPTILDMGTGTGCIPIALLHELPTATAIATDIQQNALKTALQNARTHGVHTRFRLRHADWFSGITEKFDLITSNPPYISVESIANLSPEVQNHDPILALDGGKNGMEPYEIIFSQIKNHLNDGGRAFLEIGFDQCGYITRLAEKTGIRIEAIHPDLAGIPRVVEISCGDK